MAITCRNNNDAIVRALLVAHNVARGTTATVGSSFHADITAATSGDSLTPAYASLQVTAANASTLPTSVTLANNIQSVALAHLADAIGGNTYQSGAHKIKDATNNTTAPTAVDLATGITLANAWKAQLNAHYTQSGVHYNNDGTNTIAASNATDQSSLNTLLNAIKTALNAHITNAPTSGLMINVVAQ